LTTLGKSGQLGGGWGRRCVERVRVGDKDDLVDKVFLWEKTSGSRYGSLRGRGKGKGWAF